MPECSIVRYEEILPTILEWIPHIVVQEPKELETLVSEKVENYRERIK